MKPGPKMAKNASRRNFTERKGMRRRFFSRGDREVVFIEAV
jgi:hypothetical protein